MTLHSQDIPDLRRLRQARRESTLDLLSESYAQARGTAAGAQQRARDLERDLADSALVALECYEAEGVTFNGRAEFGRRKLWMITDMDTGSTMSFPGEMIPTAAMIRGECERLRARFAAEPQAAPEGSQA